MSTTLTENDLYIAFVSDLYRRDPARVVRIYRMLYPESSCWPQGPFEQASTTDIDAAVEALIEQDTQDGHDAWAFRDSFDAEG